MYNSCTIREYRAAACPKKLMEPAVIAQPVRDAKEVEARGSSVSRQTCLHHSQVMKSGKEGSVYERRDERKGRRGGWGG